LANRYSSILAKIFESKHKPGSREVDFKRTEFQTTADSLGIKVPLNLGDLIYSFRYRSPLPESIQKTAPRGKCWIIRPVGRGKYRFALAADKPIVPSTNMTTIKVADSTPGVVEMYSMGDEQALHAKVRYNRLIDLFTGLTCYSLQNHLRTTAPDMGQVETDEIYIGVNKAGAHYVIPVQAKGGKDKIGIVQIEQDMAVCASRFPLLICRPIAAQFMTDDEIALFEFGSDDKGVGVSSERHYKLVQPDQISEADLAQYKKRITD
jgi:hypothetical protein